MYEGSERCHKYITMGRSRDKFYLTRFVTPSLGDHTNQGTFSESPIRCGVRAELSSADLCSDCFLLFQKSDFYAAPFYSAKCVILSPSRVCNWRMILRWWQDYRRRRISNSEACLCSESRSPFPCTFVRDFTPVFLCLAIATDNFFDDSIFMVVTLLLSSTAFDFFRPSLRLGPVSDVVAAAGYRRQP